MPSSGITEKRDATVGIHHTKGQGRSHTGFPPFVLAFDHQARYAVNVAGAAPFHIGTAVATEVGTGCVAVVGDDAERALGVPGGKVPREGGLCRVTKRDDGAGGQFGMLGAAGKITHYLFETLLAVEALFVFYIGVPVL